MNDVVEKIVWDAAVEEVVAQVRVFPVVKTIVCGTRAAGEVASSVNGLAPCRYKVVLAALATGALIAPMPSPASAKPKAAATTQPSRDPRWRGPRAATNFNGCFGRREGGPGPRSHRRSHTRRRRWCTGSVIRPVFGVRYHGPSSFSVRPFRAA